MSKTILHYDLENVLKEHGFNYLTSESCSYSMRALYDITENAEELLSEFFGNNVAFNNSAWNGSNGEKHSVMLTHSTRQDLAIFILLHKCSILIRYDTEKMGINSFYRMYDSEDEMAQDRAEHTFLIECNYKKWYGNVCDRNRHAFSGRLD